MPPSAAAASSPSSARGSRARRRSRARSCPPTRLNYFDLEDPPSLARWPTRTPRCARSAGLVVIDENPAPAGPVPAAARARRPPPAPGPVPDPRQRVAGACAALVRDASPAAWRRCSSRAFAWRTSARARSDRHWLRGGLPSVVHRPHRADSLAWRRQFLQTFLERDVPQLGVTIPPSRCGASGAWFAHYHGQIWNGAELARALAVSESTVRRYLDLMTGVFMVRQLPPWFENLAQAPGQGPQGLCPRHRPAARARGHRQRAATSSATPRSARPGRATPSRKS